LEIEKISGSETVEFEILRISIGLFGQIQRRYIVQLKASLAPSTAETL